MNAGLVDKPIKILLVEDNPTDALVLRQSLVEAALDQFEPTHVERLSEAVQQLGESGFDLILLDLLLPDSQGFETVVKIQDQAMGVPVVVLTGVDDEALAVQAVQWGAQDYLVKGQVDSALLVRAIRYAIERHRLLTERTQTEKELVRLERMRAVGEMAQGVAHNFNNIMTGVLGYGDRIQMNASDPEIVEDAAAHVVESALRARDLARLLYRNVGNEEQEVISPYRSRDGPEKAALFGIKRLTRTFQTPNKGGPYDDRV